MRNKKCFICGASFKSRALKARYCSVKCRREGQRANRVKWESDNPEYMKNYMQKQRKTKGEDFS